MTQNSGTATKIGFVSPFWLRESFSPAESNVRVLLKALLNRKWCEVMQNSPHLLLSLPWAVMTAYSSTWRLEGEQGDCRDARADRKLGEALAVRAPACVYLLGGCRNEECDGFVSLVVMFVEGASAEEWHQSEGAEPPFVIIGAIIWSN